MLQAHTEHMMHKMEIVNKLFAHGNVQA